MMISNRASATAFRARRARLFFFAGFLLCAACIAFWREPLAGLLLRTVSPVLQARYAPAESSVSTDALVADRDALYAENADLKARLGRVIGVEKILAGVLVRPPATPYDTLLLDAGSAEGVAIDDRVSAGGTVIVGTVSEVYAHASRVHLYSSPGEKYDGLLRGSIPVAVEGQGGGSMRAQIPSGIAAAEGDTVSLPGVAGGVFARVTHIDQGENESFVTIYLSLPVNFSSMRFVEVWKETHHDTN